MNENGNSPAYPQPATPAGFRAKWSDGFGGLTKREEFARSAQAAILGNAWLIETITSSCDSTGRPIRAKEIILEVSERAIAYADALLEALERGDR